MKNNLVSGKISKIVNDGEIKYGFVKVKKLGEVFFSLKTDLQNTAFENLTLGGSVKITAVETDRGLFAESLKTC